VSDPLIQAARVAQPTPQSVCFKTYARGYGQTTVEDVLVDLSQAHPKVRNALAASHSCENTVSTSALLGVFKTLCEMAKAVRNRSYVIAAASTSQSGKLSASISSTLPSNAVLNSFIVFDLLEVVEITWPDATPIVDAPTTERERIVLSALAAILLEVADHPDVKPHSTDSYLPDHLIADAMAALQPYGAPQ